MLNKRMLTMEDANSILKHFGKGFHDVRLFRDQ